MTPGIHRPCGMRNFSGLDREFMCLIEEMSAVSNLIKKFTFSTVKCCEQIKTDDEEYSSLTKYPI